MKLPKHNQKGITHILAPIAFIGVFAAIGGIALLITHADTNNSNVTCDAYGYPGQAQPGQSFKEHLTIHNSKTVYFTPRVTYQVTDYKGDGSSSKKTYDDGYWDKIAPGQQESKAYSRVFPGNNVNKEVFNFQVYWGSSTTAAAVCSATERVPSIGL